MMSIGEFARLAGVSVRMLRHYDQLGLLRPHRVDPHTGYRSYAAAQLDRANHLVALKDLGFGLERVAELLEADASGGDRVVALLRERRDELRAQIAVDRGRLARVEARLSTITKEHAMSTTLQFTETALPSLRLVQRSVVVTDMAAIEAEMGMMFGAVNEAVDAAAALRTGPGIAHYTPESGPDGDGLRAAAAEQVDGGVDGLESAELTAVDRALVTTYDAADLSGIAGAWQSLVTEVERRGLTPAGTCREVYHSTPYEPGGTRWVVELQQPLG
ncbi:MerR family transcriptional regulator [uncultured Nocardioides sp.]|uniref:MerR family transcriptional regulator n=1 Tax=uncultured Nocardioides sp. TaxID=198441 RepID=UPI0026256588|nr:MerR family transcriptional regulator [uncultured Nocardioides sp.]